VDEIWFAGDWQDEQVLIGLGAMGKPLLVVNGNAPDDDRYPESLIRQVEGLRIGMVHRPPAPGERWTGALDIVIHGHTHRWRDEIVGGVRFINASTPTAAGFSSERTMAILSVDGAQAKLERITVPSFKRQPA